MSDVYDEIQTILEDTLSNIPDIPDIAWENVDYTPTTGVPWVKPRFLPNTREASVLGPDPLQYYQGIFLVDCLLPENAGRKAGSELVSKIIDAFDASDDLTVDNNTHVLIRYAERDQGIIDGPYYRITVRIGWQSYA